MGLREIAQYSYLRILITCQISMPSDAKNLKVFLITNYTGGAPLVALGHDRYRTVGAERADERAVVHATVEEPKERICFRQAQSCSNHPGLAPMPDQPSMYRLRLQLIHYESTL